MKEFTIVLLEWRQLKRIENYSLGLHYIEKKLNDSGYHAVTLILEEMSVEDVCNQVLKYDPNIVGIRFYSETYETTFAIAHKLKELKPSVILVSGGHTASIYGAKLLLQEPCFDIVIKGEGEEAFVGICDRIKNADTFETCAGICYRQDDYVYCNDSHTSIEDLNLIQMPRLDLFQGDKQFVDYPLSTTRGCIGNCSFCVVHRVSRTKGLQKWRGMSPKKIVDEMEVVVAEHPDKLITFHFQDSAMEDPNPKTKERLERIIDLIEERSLNICFSFFTRAETWTEENRRFLSRMKKAGLYKVSIGYDESIYPHTAYDFTESAIVDTNIDTYQLFLEMGIESRGYLILFHPFITIEDLYRCAEFFEAINMHIYPDVWVHEADIYPDTKLFEQAIQDGLILTTKAGGYSYEYSFKDSRVAFVHKFITDLKQVSAFNKIRGTMTKIDNEISTYKAWESRYEPFELIHEEMEHYISESKKVYMEFGTSQKHIFTDILRRAEEQSNKESFQYEDLLNKWEESLVTVNSQLDKIWLINQMKVARKKIKIH